MAILFRARQLMGWRLRLSDKTVRKFAELSIYCQWQKCSPGNVVSGSIRFMQIFAGVRWRWGVKWKCGRWKWRFSLLSFTDFRTFYIHGHTTAFTWCDCRRLWRYFKVIWLFHIKFLKNGAWCGKSFYKLLIGNRTLAFDWCHFWWPWSTFEGHFSLGCHITVHFSNLWQAFASCGLPATAELLVVGRNREYGHSQGTHRIFWLPPINSLTGKDTAFKYGRYIYKIHPN